MPAIVIRTGEGAAHELRIPEDAGKRALTVLLAERGFPLNTRCGGRGLCRGCETELVSGRLLVEGQTVNAPATVRACQARLMGDVAIEIPARSRVGHRPQVGETFRINIPAAHQPLFLPEPGARDTAFAVDIGTTTVVVLLIDLVTGEVLSRAGGFNDQIRFGDNVLTRIDAGRAPAVLREMQTAVVAGTIAPLLARACERAQRRPSRIIGGAIAGNTAMLHLLVGRDPTPLGVAPFRADFLGGVRLSCGELNLCLRTPDENLWPDTPVQLLPGVAAYVGADIVAGVLATGMIYDPRPSLLVDLGTNGEVVLQNGSRLTACATAAGPAFEGCGLRCGSRAREGAVGAIRLNMEPFQIGAEVIGGGSADRATGICGSAYLDFLAEGRRCGLLSPTGRFESASWKSLAAQRRVRDEDGRSLRLAGGGDGGGLVISEVDVALLLQAKAAIGAGVETLLKRVGLEPREIGCVHLAGGFGMHLNVANAIAIGLLPGFTREQVEVVGNSALAGAMLALLDRTTLEEMEALRDRVEVVELNMQEGFEDRFVDHLLLP